jgi:hypothetical protein
VKPTATTLLATSGGMIAAAYADIVRPQHLNAGGRPQPNVPEDAIVTCGSEAATRWAS